MSNQIGTAYIDVRPDWTGFNRDVDRATSGAKGKFAAFGRAASAGVAAAAIGLAALGKASVDAATESEKSTAKMKAQLKALGISYGKNADEIEKVIQKTSKLAGLDDEELQDAFTNIVRTTGDVDKSLRLVGLAADFARAKNIDVAKAGEIVAKVAGGNTGVLSRYGVTIEKGASATEALGAMQDKFAGQAKAYGETTAGAQDRLKVSVENLQEKFGRLLLPVVEKVANGLSDLVDKAESGRGVFGWLKTAWHDVGEAFKGGGDKAAMLSTVIQNLRSVTEGLVTIGTALWERFGHVIVDQLKNVIDMVGSVLEGATTALRGLVDLVAGVFTGDWSRAWDGVKAIFSGVWQIITAQLEYAFESMKNVVRAAFLAFVSIIKGLAQPFIDAGKGIVNRVTEGVKGGANAVASAAGWVKNRIVDGIHAAQSGFKTAGSWITNRVSEGVKTVTGPLGSIGGWVKNRIVEAIEFQVGHFLTGGKWIINRIADGITTVTDALSRVGGWIKNRVVDGLEAVKDGFESVGGKMIDWIVGGLKAGAKKLVGFLDVLIGLVNKIPGVNIGKIAWSSSSEGGDSGEIPVVGLARGGQLRRGTRLTHPTVMMGEEAPRHPEYVIPTNPAYRDRALSLTGGLLRELGLVGMADGGIMGLARRVWDTTTDVMRSKGSMPPIGFAKLGTGKYAHFNPTSGRVTISPAMLQALRDPEHGRHDNALSSLVHEFAHARQRADVILGDRRLTEGGADLFTTWADNQIFRKLGVPFRNAPSAYPAESEFTRKNRSEWWWKRGQFGPSTPAALASGPAGIPAPDATASGVFGIIKSVGGKLAGLVKDLLGPLPDPEDFLPPWIVGLGKYVVGRAADFIKSKAGSILGIGDTPGLGEDQIARVAKMVKRMDGIHARRFPYKYGGGHGSFNGPYDCSGLVSAILNAGGFLGSPVTTDGLKTFGVGGGGKVITIGVRGSTGRRAHTMMRIGNKYLESGSGHGAQWVGGWSGGFPIMRHPEGFAKGGVFARYLAEQILRPLRDPAAAGWGLAKGGVVGGPFVGSYATGGVVPRDGLAYVHQGETITPAGGTVVEVKFHDDRLRDLIDVQIVENGRRSAGAYRAGVTA